MKPKTRPKLTDPAKILATYRANHAKYEASGDTDRAGIQARLIARLEADT